MCFVLIDICREDGWWTKVRNSIEAFGKRRRSSFNASSTVAGGSRRSSRMRTSSGSSVAARELERHREELAQLESYSPTTALLTQSRVTGSRKYGSLEPNEFVTPEKIKVSSDETDGNANVDDLTELGQWNSPVHSHYQQESITSSTGVIHCALSNEEVKNSSTTPATSTTSSEYHPQVVFKENWKQKQRRYQLQSPIGHLPGYRLIPVIVKSNDDLRQEQIISQLISQMNDILVEAKVGCWLRSYDIISLTNDSGIIEAIPDTISIDALKRSIPNGQISLNDYFLNFFSEYHIDDDLDMSELVNLSQAKENFMRSLAGYAIISYLLQIKDRHNGNILLDIYGHMMHIDFGFVLGITPGGNIGFENAPFKLTAEMVEVLGGSQSSLFYKFR